MSRLSFKETEYSDEGESDNIMVYTNEESGYVDSDVSDSEIVKSSYALYGIDPGNIPSRGSPKSEKAAVKQLQAKLKEASANMLSTTAMVSADDPISEQEAEADSSKSKSAKKKRKKRKLDESQHVAIGEDVSSAAPSITAIRESSFLSKFLSKKREMQEVPEPPEIEPANESFLKLFQDTFVPSSSAATADATYASTGTADENSDDDDFAQSALSPAKPTVKRVLSSASVNTSTETEDERAPISVPAPDAGSNTVALQFFNLPYRISPEQLQAFGKKRGFKFTSVVMGVDWKTKLPSGSATVHVEFDTSSSAPPADKEENEEVPLYADLLDEEVAECIQALQGEDCGGRPLRVQRFVAKTRKSGSLGGRGDARYFSEDISCKCHNCGLVGHRQQECTNDSVPLPCHLCAGLDHEAGGCPNITCYRCGKFGHHSRDCTFASMSRPVICTNCGSNRHDIRGCRDLSVHYKPGMVIPDSKVAGPLVRCMSCNKYGHVMCQALPEIPPSTADAIYCPNCGESGHHIDFPQLCREVSPSNGNSGSGGTSESGKKRARGGGNSQSTPVFSQCMEPKYEAFVKFGSALSEIDVFKDPAARIEYFQEITRRCGQADKNLFPPLARLPSASSSSGAQNGNARSRHSIGGSADTRDTGRSVVRYQDGVQRLQQNAAPQNERERFASALEAVTAGRKVGYDRGGADYYEREQDAPGSGHKRAKTNHAPPQHQQYQQQGGGGGSRRHSYPLNVPQRHENQHRSHGGNHHNGGGQHQHQQHSRWDNNQGGRQAAPSVLDPAWSESAYYPQAPYYSDPRYGPTPFLLPFPPPPPPPVMYIPPPPPLPAPQQPLFPAHEVTLSPDVSGAAAQEVFEARKRKVREWAASRHHS